MTRRLTTAQALIEFLAQQYTERDGVRQRFFAGCFGIFGHGNVAGVGEALLSTGDKMPYIMARNEQGMVHAAAGYARMKNRLATYACTSSIGPGATNMVTAAAGATINRLPVLLLPGDIFTAGGPAPVLQQLEDDRSTGVSVNDCFRPISRFFDRIERPEQLPRSLMSALGVLTDPVRTGAVTLALPQDVQAEAWDWPDGFFRERVWHIPRPSPDPAALSAAIDAVKEARRPLIVAGGGVIYSDATAVLRTFAEATGIPVAETQAGKGSLPYDHPCNLGAIGVTGTPGANGYAREADLIIGIGTRWSDFTTSSSSLFQHSGARFINVNVATVDAGKHAAIPLVADGRAALEALGRALQGHRVQDEVRDEVAQKNHAWDEEVARLYGLGNQPLPSQGEVIGTVNAASGPRDVVVCAAGSMPGDLHKLWRTRDPKGYHVEYGYSCMGYEIPGGMGVKLADPEREVFVLIGDGSYLMLPGELVTAVAENVKLIIVIVQNHGYASIGSLSRSLGTGGFGTQYRYGPAAGELKGDKLPVDLAANAASLGATVMEVRSVAELAAALERAKAASTTTVVHVEVDPSVAVPGYDTWWNVPVAEVSTIDTVKEARGRFEDGLRSVRPYL